MVLEYAVDIIVGVIFQSQWSWYVSEKEFWFMDLSKFRQAFINRGYSELTPNYSWRFNIPSLNENTAEQFFNSMEKYHIDTTTLSELILAKPFTNCWDDISELCPSLLLNFERKSLKSLFPEPASFEHYVPDGWHGEYSDFLSEIPKQQRYWIIEGRDYFRNCLI